MNRIYPTLAAGLAFCAAPFAHALSGAGVSTTAPTGSADPGWANVGQVNGDSCVYLGDYASGYWVISAAHVIATDSGAVSLNGSSYSIVSGSGVQLVNAGNSTYPTADLYLFRIVGDSSLAGLSNITLASTAPASGSGNATLTVIGWGGGTKGYGTVSVNGANCSIAPGVVTVSGANGNSELFEATSSDVQLISGDSGGAIFIKTGGQWLLTGLSEASGTNGSNFVAVGSQLSTYKTQIDGYLTAVPEPSTYAVMAGGAGLVAMGVRRRRRGVK